MIVARVFALSKPFIFSPDSLSSTCATCCHRRLFKNNTRHHPRHVADMSFSPTNSSNTMSSPLMDKITLTVGSPSMGSSIIVTSSSDNAIGSRVVMDGETFWDWAIEDLWTLGSRDGLIEVPPNGVWEGLEIGDHDQSTSWSLPFKNLFHCWDLVALPWFCSGCSREIWCLGTSVDSECYCCIEKVCVGDNDIWGIPSVEVFVKHYYMHR